MSRFVKKKNAPTGETGTLDSIVLVWWWYRAEVFRKCTEHEKGILVTPCSKLTANLVGYRILDNSPITHGFCGASAIGTANEERHGVLGFRNQ
jgi:hypothetical protein